MCLLLLFFVCFFLNNFSFKINLQGTSPGDGGTHILRQMLLYWAALLQEILKHGSCLFTKKKKKLLNMGPIFWLSPNFRVPKNCKICEKWAFFSRKILISGCPFLPKWPLKMGRGFEWHTPVQTNSEYLPPPPALQAHQHPKLCLRGSQLYFIEDQRKYKNICSRAKWRPLPELFQYIFMHSRDDQRAKLNGPLAGFAPWAASWAPALSPVMGGKSFRLQHPKPYNLGQK